MCSLERYQVPVTYWDTGGVTLNEPIARSPGHLKKHARPQLQVYKEEGLERHNEARVTYHERVGQHVCVLHPVSIQTGSNPAFSCFWLQ